jgi:curved DNA-binding protein CbpA
MAEEVPDLYEVLSVQRWADQPLIEAQYRRKYEAYVQAGQDTDELDEAYAILSDPESRGEYDDMLFSQEEAALEAERAEGDWESDGGSWSFMKIASWGFSAVILFSLLSTLVGSLFGGNGGGESPAPSQTASVVQSSQPPRTFGQVNAFELRDGECFNEPNALTNLDAEKPLTIVSCFGAYDFKVLTTIVTTLNGIFPQATYFERQAAALCDDRTDVFYRPNEVSWSLGDRDIKCMEAYSQG